MRGRFISLKERERHDTCLSNLAISLVHAFAKIGMQEWRSKPCEEGNL
jgi:hypothetical protein